MSNIQKKSNTEISKDFRSAVVKLENDLKAVADGESVVAGTKEKPIITENKILPIKHFFIFFKYMLR